MQSTSLVKRATEALGDVRSVDDLWSEYQSTGSAVARDHLVLHYTGLVTHVASRVGASMPSNVDYSDLIQAGVIGLIDAIERFEPERGLKFETFAVTRIRGSIIDDLRALDWVPRSVRRKARDLHAAAEGFQTREGRMPDSAELAAELQVTVTDVASARSVMVRMHVGELDELLSTSGGGDTLSLADTLADPWAELPGDTLLEQGTREALSMALEQLCERDRAVLVHSYFDGLTLAQIGNLLGVTESRVSQIRTRALRHLREQLQSVIGD